MIYFDIDINFHFDFDFDFDFDFVETNNYSSLQITQPITQSPLYQKNRPRGTSKTIGSIIRGFKIGVIKLWQQNISAENISSMQIWQRNYYDHIIRNNDELNRIRQYIIENPMKWKMDDNYMN